MNMFKNTKGQGISINVIIIAAIALLVLVILSVLLIKGGSDLSVGSSSCQGVGGLCTSSCSDLSTGTTIYARHPTASCELEGDICCIVLKN